MSNELHLGLFGWAAKSISQRGLVKTVKVAASMSIDVWFDFRYGTETIRWVDLASLNISPDGKNHGNPYKATKAAAFRKLMSALGLPKAASFVDFGAGKGRVLLLAAQYGFQRCVGVEIAQELCEVARNNARRMDFLDRIEIVHCSVTEYRIEADQTIFFFYNPFDRVVTCLVLDHIAESVKKYPRKIWLLYNTPKYHQEVLDTGLFSECREYEISGTEFRVYHN